MRAVATETPASDSAPRPRIIESAINTISVSDPVLGGLERCCMPVKVNDVRTNCGAQSFVRIQYATGELTVCGHHLTSDYDALTAKAIVVHDMRAAINAKPSPSV